jgi:glutamine amidotransferase-like uncharacterized protein
MTGEVAPVGTEHRRPGGQALALVYRGPAADSECSEAAADLLHRSRWDLDVHYVGPRERLRLSADLLSATTLYTQPGGGDLGRAYRKLRRHATALRDYVGSGGRYLGFCLGAYLAGEEPGFGLLPGDTDQYISSHGATVTTYRDAVIEITWGGHVREVYFQDGPWFDLDRHRGPADILATYDNGLPAALVAPYGRGVVGVVGPHPEATPAWFTDVGLRPPEPLATDLGLELVDRVMAAGAEEARGSDHLGT